MARIQLKPIQTNQGTLLQNLAKKTFTETFGHDNSPEQLETYYRETYSLSLLSEELKTLNLTIILSPSMTR